MFYRFRLNVYFSSIETYLMQTFVKLPVPDAGVFEYKILSLLRLRAF